MSTWWKRASQEERLKQIDAGIELGMTGRQVAMNLRVPMYPGGKQSAVDRFANSHGRHFNGDYSKVRREAKRNAGVISAQRRGLPNLQIRSAFSIFEDDQARPPLFDTLPYEEA